MIDASIPWTKSKTSRRSRCGRSEQDRADEQEHRGAGKDSQRRSAMRTHQIGASSALAAAARSRESETSSAATRLQAAVRESARRRAAPASAAVSMISRGSSVAIATLVTGRSRHINLRPARSAIRHTGSGRVHCRHAEDEEGEDDHRSGRTGPNQPGMAEIVQPLHAEREMGQDQHPEDQRRISPHPEGQDRRSSPFAINHAVDGYAPDEHRGASRRAQRPAVNAAREAEKQPEKSAAWLHAAGSISAATR